LVQKDQKVLLVLKDQLEKQALLEIKVLKDLLARKDREEMLDQLVKLVNQDQSGQMVQMALEGIQEVAVHQVVLEKQAPKVNLDEQDLKD